PLKAVQEFLGHKSITTTERYAHLSPEFQLQAVNALLAYHPKREVRRRGARRRRVFAVISGRRGAAQAKGARDWARTAIRKSHNPARGVRSASKSATRK